MSESMALQYGLVMEILYEKRYEKISIEEIMNEIEQRKTQKKIWFSISLDDVKAIIKEILGANYLTLFHVSKLDLTGMVEKYQLTQSGIERYFEMKIRREQYVKREAEYKEIEDSEKRQKKRTRNLLIGCTIGAVVVIIAAIIFAISLG